MRYAVVKLREPYTIQEIQTAVERDRVRLFGSYAMGRPPGWSVDPRTRDHVCLEVWIREELTNLELDDLGRLTQQGLFNRLSRGTDDLFGLAAEIMNDALVDRIDRFRKPHRRWG